MRRGGKGATRATGIKKIPWGMMALTFLLALVYEALHLTPLKRLARRFFVKVEERRATVAGLPLVEYRKDDGKRKRLVIAQHGYGARKEGMRDFAVKLAAAGYFVVTPDAVGHGERDEPGARGIPEIVETAVAEYDALITAYRGREDVDAENFSIVGRSLGGSIAYRYALRGRYKPQAIAPTITSPDFRDLVNYQLGLSRYEGHRIVHLEDPKEIGEQNRLLEETNHFEELVALEDVAVLAQNMRFDFLVRPEGSERLVRARAARKSGTSSRPFEYRCLFAFFHYIPDRAQKNIIAFLKAQG